MTAVTYAFWFPILLLFNRVTFSLCGGPQSLLGWIGFLVLQTALWGAVPWIVARGFAYEVKTRVEHLCPGGAKAGEGSVPVRRFGLEGDPLLAGVIAKCYPLAFMVYWIVWGFPH